MLEPPPLKTHTYAIDILRATAALGVLCYHQHMGLLLARYSGLGVFNLIDKFGAQYAVPLFFLLSGYCIHLSNIKYLRLNQPLPIKTYLKRRFLRIYPAYLIALAVSIAINRFTGFNPGTSKSDLLIHLLLLQGFFSSSFNTINLVLWTISIEFALYLLYPIFYYLRLKYSLNIALLVSFIISFSSILFFSTKDSLSFPQLYFVTNLWFAWCCGCYLADKKIFDPEHLKKPAYKILYLFILFAAMLCTWKDQFLPGYQFYILAWTAPVMFLLSKESWFKKYEGTLTRLFLSIGLSSYSLYLLHQPLIIFKNFIASGYISPRYQPYVMVLGFLIIPLVAWVSYLIIEKPFMKSIKQDKVLTAN